MPTPNDYDRIAYPSFAHAQTFAENLATKGWLRGMDVAPPDHCRVLELGCGDGFNLVVMAQRYPKAHYTGLDYAADAIERGRRMVEELGLSQVRLEAADIRNLPPDLGEFDYIIAHGVFSWVPLEVADAVLQTMKDHLSPQGVGFVSYLALPGAQMREMVRLMLNFHTQGESEPTRRIQQARGLLHLLSNATTEANHYTQWLKSESAVIAAHTDAAFFHDELSTFSHSFLFTDFLRQASTHQLAFLSEAEYLIPVSINLTDEAKRILKPLEADRVMLEQYLDFVEGRRFRQTLLCRPGNGASLTAARVRRFHIRFAGQTTAEGSLDLAAPAELTIKGERDAVLHVKTPVEKAMLLALRDSPDALPYPELCELALARLKTAGLAIPPDADQSLAPLAVRAAVPQLIELTSGMPPATAVAPARPLASPLARWQVAQGHKSITTLGGPSLAFEGELGRFLLSRMDGTRDRTVLLSEVQSYLTRVHAEAKAAGRTFSGPDPDAPDLELQLSNSLQSLARFGLILRDGP